MTWYLVKNKDNFTFHPRGPKVIKKNQTNFSFTPAC